MKSWCEEVAPARATRETAYVLLTAVIVLLLAAWLIQNNQKDQSHTVQLASHEISLRYELKPAEQGIVADLLLAYEEWTLQDDHHDEAARVIHPEIADWQAENWPPFTDVAEGKRRGGHQWQKLRLGEAEAYLGVSQETDIAGHFLWVLPAKRLNDGVMPLELWLHRGDHLPELKHFEETGLIAAGWRSINRNPDAQR